MRRRELIGLASATLIHIVFLACFVLVPQKTPVSMNKGDAAASTGEDKGAITVAIFRPPSTVSHTPTTAQALEALRRRLSVQTPDSVAAAQPSPLRRASLLDLFGPATPEQPKTDKVAEARGAQAGSPDGATPKVIDPMALASLPPALRAEPNLLWPQVARCWRPARAPADVIMVVNLDAKGRIEGAPIIYRVGAAAGLSQAEQEAVRAVRSCAPYHTPAGAAAAYNLRFKSNESG